MELWVCDFRTVRIKPRGKWTPGRFYRFLWPLVCITFIGIYLLTCVATVSMFLSYMILGQLSPVDGSAHDFNDQFPLRREFGDVMLLLLSVKVLLLTSETHHQSGTAPPTAMKTIAHAVGDSARFIKTKIIIWYFPNEPSCSMIFSSSMTSRGVPNTLKIYESKNYSFLKYNTNIYRSSVQWYSCLCVCDIQKADKSVWRLGVWSNVKGSIWDLSAHDCLTYNQ